MMHNEIASETMHNEIASETMHNEIASETMMHNEIASETMHDEIASETMMHNEIASETMHNGIASETMHDEIASETMHTAHRVLAVDSHDLQPRSICQDIFLEIDLRWRPVLDHGKKPKVDRGNSDVWSTVGPFWVKPTSLSGHHSQFGTNLCVPHSRQPLTRPLRKSLRIRHGHRIAARKVATELKSSSDCCVVRVITCADILKVPGEVRSFWGS